MSRIHLYTIGFTKKSAEQFFTRLAEAGVKRVIDVRLNNVSQLAGFAKRDDLRFFLKGLYGIDYVQLPQLAPTQPMLDAYKKNGGDWTMYEKQFLALIEERQIDRLGAVQARIAMGVIARGQVLLRHRRCAAQTLGHLLARHLNVHAARISAFGGQNVHEAAHFGQDAIERPRLVAARRCDRVAVHGIAGPHDRPALPFHGTDERRQVLGDFVRPEPADERQSSRLVVGIEDVDKPKKFVGEPKRYIAVSHP